MLLDCSMKIIHYLNSIKKMPRWFVVYKPTMKPFFDYKSETCQQHTFPDEEDESIGNVNTMVHIPCDDFENCPVEFIKARKSQNGTIELYLDDVAYNESLKIERENTMEYLRNKRNQLLKDSDFILLSDVPMNEEKRKEWLVYRQALRDYPDSISDPLAPPPFPTRPI